MSEDELRLRKLKAETELAERKLRASKKKWKTCNGCGGHGRLRRCLGRTGMAREGWTWDLCGSCDGKGGYYYYAD